ncbi:hypothetical protein [Oceanobacter mangrovi]|uniref:hypothetical protein n=1 Tax=Oceanobacter mangrovi TaxID=2862510 RepID=UPI001C8D9C56|nr:hypothetical protein [Oceanobacter mangrovi]
MNMATLGIILIVEATDLPTGEPAHGSQLNHWLSHLKRLGAKDFSCYVVLPYALPELEQRLWESCLEWGICPEPEPDTAHLLAYGIHQTQSAQGWIVLDSQQQEVSFGDIQDGCQWISEHQHHSPQGRAISGKATWPIAFNQSCGFALATCHHDDICLDSRQQQQQTLSGWLTH